MSDLATLLADIRACRICDGLPLGPNPIVQASATSRILIVGQAPGRITHAKSVPFDDPSGNNLRNWMGITREVFYDAARIACAPMGFCYPGTGKGGDLPPRQECAAHWRTRLMAQLPSVRLTLAIGQYAQDWHLPEAKGLTLTDRVKGWRAYGAGVIPLPHPSPRNGIWLKANPWFQAEVLPDLRKRVVEAIA